METKHPSKLDVLHRFIETSDGFSVPHDNVENPVHYTQGKIQPIDFIESQNLGFHEANCVKYLTRWKHKNGVEDLKKARWYLDRLIASKE